MEIITDPTTGQLLINVLGNTLVKITNDLTLPKCMFYTGLFVLQFLVYCRFSSKQTAQQ